MRHPNPAIARAMEAVQQAIPQAERDPARPAFHFRPPAQWMNDPNGPIYHNGFYHVFYQHNPYGDEWGNMHWGHTRSTDLVHWEHLPIALWPSKELGEEHCYSGCAHINGRGEPMLFYTKVAADRETIPNEQWAALSDDEMIFWRKHPENPILDPLHHGGPRFGNAWRDPFIFEEQGRTFMVLGADLEDRAVIPIYEAQDASLAHWTYRGILFELPQTDIRFFECPNFFRVGDQWVLLCSPYRPIEYFVGQFDLDTCTFVPNKRGLFDQTDHFYASNILFDPQGRCIVLGWIRGWKPGRGWNGCMSLPRVLTIAGDQTPRQQPIPELAALRRDHVQLVDISLDRTTQKVDGICGDGLELRATILPGDAAVCGIRLCRPDGAPLVTIQWSQEPARLHVAEDSFAFPLAAGEPLDLHLFYDRSVLEVFANQRVTCTQVLDHEGAPAIVQLLAESGKAAFQHLDIWSMASIWS